MRFTPKHFDPLRAGGEPVGDEGRVLFRAGDRPQDTYVYTTRIQLALNVAMATGRPLLISGEPGSGKTTLAASAAGVLGWWSYKQMVTSRTQASDLLWIFDALGRLNDANLRGQTLRPKHFYVEPGRLWWALNPETAHHRGLTDIPEEDKDKRAANPGAPPIEKEGRPVSDAAVLLLDEIDKADPDVPNDLLEPLDIHEFTVRETNHRIVPKRRVLIMMTTNGERELPPAFMRRCVSLKLDPPDEDWFVDIANRKYPDRDPELHRAVAREVMVYRKVAGKAGLRQPSTGEYLDALEACREVRIDTASDAWGEVALSMLWKRDREPKTEALDAARKAVVDGEEG